jgi:hypothetical protein
MGFVTLLRYLGVYYANFRFYVETIRRVWGQGKDLRPMGCRPEAPRRRQTFFDW